MFPSVRKFTKSFPCCAICGKEEIGEVARKPADGNTISPEIRELKEFVLGMNKKIR